MPAALIFVRRATHEVGRLFPGRLGCLNVSLAPLSLAKKEKGLDGSAGLMAARERQGEKEKKTHTKSSIPFEIFPFLRRLRPYVALPSPHIGLSLPCVCIILTALAAFATPEARLHQRTRHTRLRMWF